MRALLEHWRTRHDWCAAERMLNGWNPSRTRIDGLDIDFAHVRLPTLPGFGFSAAPAEPGWGITRTAAAWEVLMARPGYGRWGAQGGELGGAVIEELARRGATGLAGIHLNMLTFTPTPQEIAEADPDERAALAEAERFQRDQSAYALLQSTQPQTIGYSLTDSLTDSPRGSTPSSSSRAARQVTRKRASPSTRCWTSSRGTGCPARR